MLPDNDVILSGEDYWNSNDSDYASRYDMALASNKQSNRSNALLLEDSSSITDVAGEWARKTLMKYRELDEFEVLEREAEILASSPGKPLTSSNTSRESSSTFNSKLQNQDETSLRRWGAVTQPSSAASLPLKQSDKFRDDHKVGDDDE